MAKDQTVRVRPDILAGDQQTYVALQEIGNYQPANPAYNKEALAAKAEALRGRQEGYVHAENALAAARDDLAAAEWDFHDAVLGLKDQVVAQFGPNSNEVQSLGLKKKSERAKPAAKKSAA